MSANVCHTPVFWPLTNAIKFLSVLCDILALIVCDVQTRNAITLFVHTVPIAFRFHV